MNSVSSKDNLKTASSDLRSHTLSEAISESLMENGYSSCVQNLSSNAESMSADASLTEETSSEDDGASNAKVTFRPKLSLNNEASEMSGSSDESYDSDEPGFVVFKPSKFGKGSLKASEENKSAIDNMKAENSTYSKTEVSELVAKKHSDLATAEDVKYNSHREEPLEASESSSSQINGDKTSSDTTVGICAHNNSHQSGPNMQILEKSLENQIVASDAENLVIESTSVEQTSQADAVIRTKGQSGTQTKSFSLSTCTNYSGDREFFLGFEQNEKPENSVCDKLDKYIMTNHLKIDQKGTVTSSGTSELTMSISDQSSCSDDDEKSTDVNSPETHDHIYELMEAEPIHCDPGVETETSGEASRQHSNNLEIESSSYADDTSGSDETINSDMKLDKSVTQSHCDGELSFQMPATTVNTDSLLSPDNGKLREVTVEIEDELKTNVKAVHEESIKDPPTVVDSLKLQTGNTESSKSPTEAQFSSLISMTNQNEEAIQKVPNNEVKTEARKNVDEHMKVDHSESMSDAEKGSEVLDNQTVENNLKTLDLECEIEGVDSGDRSNVNNCEIDKIEKIFQNDPKKTESSVKTFSVEQNWKNIRNSNDSKEKNDTSTIKTNYIGEKLKEPMSTKKTFSSKILSIDETGTSEIRDVDANQQQKAGETIQEKSKPIKGPPLESPTFEDILNNSESMEKIELQHYGLGNQKADTFEINKPNFKFMETAGNLSTENEIDMSELQMQCQEVNHQDETDQFIDDPTDVMITKNTSAMPNKDINKITEQTEADQIKIDLKSEVVGGPNEGKNPHVLVSNKSNEDQDHVQNIPSMPTIRRFPSSHGTAPKQPFENDIDEEEPIKRMKTEVVDASDDEEYLPIQPEVVMSDSSESDSESANDNLIQATINQYAASMVKAQTHGKLITHPPPNDKLDSMTNLNTWQLRNGCLPQYTPKIEPPAWVRLGIPPEGYKCLSCGDVFFLESSLSDHKQRQSVLISFECKFCKVKLYFFNRCTLREHLRIHVQKGEILNENRAEVKSLPLQMMKLMETLVIPAPAQLQACPTQKTARNVANAVDAINVSLSHTSTAPVLAATGSSLASTASLPVNVSRSPATKPTETLIDVPCCLCNEKFTSIRDLMDHMGTVQDSSEQQVACEQCNLVLPSACAARAHVFIHAPPCERTVCPECGSKCEGARDFVQHLNLCGHQYRRSGFLCFDCKLCFFRTEQSFLEHWLSIHCEVRSQCSTCHSIKEKEPCPQGMHTLVNIRQCSRCKHTSEANVPFDQWKKHMANSHPWVFNSIMYVYKSKFCSNAFRNKHEFLLHHQKEHSKDTNSSQAYQITECSLSEQVTKLQQGFLGDQEDGNYISLSTPLEPAQQAEADKRVIPTVVKLSNEISYHSASRQSAPPKSVAPKKFKRPKRPDSRTLEKLRPMICYRCGENYGCSPFKEHLISCIGFVRERVCLVCKATATGPGFMDHCLEHIQDGMLLCMYCNGRTFSCSNDLTNHFYQHVNEQFVYPVECIFCAQSLVNASKAYSHIKIKHHTEFVRTANNECQTCHRMFHGGRGLQLHQYKCQLKAPTSFVSVKICNFCKKSISTENAEKHVTQHLEEGALICVLCEGAFLQTRSKLLEHLKHHASSLKYPKQCMRATCSVELSDEGNAFHHFKQEHGFEKIQCGQCDKAFSYVHVLERHVSIAHTRSTFAKRRYICWICQAFEHAKKFVLHQHIFDQHHIKHEDIDEEVAIRKRCRNQFATPIASRYAKKGSGDSEGSDSQKAQTDSPKSITIEEKRNEENSLELKMPIDNLSIVYSKHFLSNMKNYEGFKSPEKDDSGDRPAPESPSSKVKRNFVRTRVDSKLSSVTTAHVLLPKLDPATFMPLISKETPIKATKKSVKGSTEPNNKGSILVSASAQSTKTDETERLTKPTINTSAGTVPIKRSKVSCTGLPKPIFKNVVGLDKIKSNQKQLIRTNDLSVAEKRAAQTARKSRSAYKRPIKTPIIREPVKLQSLESPESTKAANETDNNKETEGFICATCEDIFVTKSSLDRHKFFEHGISRNQKKASPLVQKKKFLKLLNLEKSSVAEKVPEQPPMKKVKVSENLKRRRTQDTEHIQEDVQVPNCFTGDPLPKKRRFSLDTTVQTKRESQCSVCKEQFDDAAAMHKHLKVHGMAFLKLGTKKRGIV